MTAEQASTFSAHLQQRGGSAAYCRKMSQTVERAGDDPAGWLAGLAESATQATLDDYRNRLRIYAAWLESQGRAEEAARWRVERVVSERQARSRAAFSVEDVRALVGCERIPEWRRTFYRVAATLGLRPVEIERLRPEHLVRSGKSWTLAMPGARQKSGRADRLTVDAGLAQAILRDLPLVREPLTHYERRFQRDLILARLLVTDESGAVRRLYGLRSFFVSELLRAGLDLESVRQLARHAKIETTLKHYARHRTETVGAQREAVFSLLA